MKRIFSFAAEDFMALKCPKCKALLEFCLFNMGKRFPCPHCGADIKMTMPSSSCFTFIFWILPPILDVIWLMIMSGHASKHAKVSFVDEALNLPYLEAERIALENERAALDAEKAAFGELPKFAKTGDAAAQYALGKGYEEGRIVEKNDAEAFNWFLKSAVQGNAEAQEALGEVYFKGQGTERSYEDAYFWHSLAEKAGRAEGSAAALRRYLPAKKIDAIDKRVAEWSPDKG